MLFVAAASWEEGAVFYRSDFFFLIFGRVTRDYVPILGVPMPSPYAVYHAQYGEGGNQAQGSSGGILRFRLVVHAAEDLYKVFIAQFFWILVFEHVIRHHVAPWATPWYPVYQAPICTY